MHGVAAVLPAGMAYIFPEVVVLASMFAVIHNIPETKPLYEGAEAIAVPVRSLLSVACTKWSSALMQHVI